MESHKKILSILYMVSGGLNLFFGILAIAFFSSLFPLLAEEAGNDAWVVELVGSFLGLIVIIVLTIYALPSFIGAIGVMNNKKWGMVLLLIIGCFKLFLFPVGTALGVYTIWVYVEDQKEKIF